MMTWGNRFSSDDRPSVNQLDHDRLLQALASQGEPASRNTEFIDYSVVTARFVDGTRVYRMNFRASDLSTRG